MAYHADDLQRVKIPTHEEPTGLIMQIGKRPDEATLIPCSRGKALACDVTISDTYTASHRQSTALEAARAAIHAEMKCTKYRELDATHIFVPIAIETSGTWDKQATELIGQDKCLYHLPSSRRRQMIQTLILFAGGISNS